jgi:hypothetical protein
MKQILTIILCHLVANVAFAGPLADTAKKQAQQCADAQIAKDYTKVISFTHPAIIKAGGGKEALQTAMESAMKGVAEQGIIFEKTVIHSATEPKKVGKDLVSQLVQEVTLRIPDGKVKQESVLLGYSYDAGKNWVFADTGEMDEATFKKFFPELKGIIDLPKKKEPVMVNKK